MNCGTYESEELLNQYLLFHYGSEQDQLPWDFGPSHALNFPARCISEGVDASRLMPCERALDVGCSVGRSSFELARKFVDVIGIDYSHTFINAANALLQRGTISCLTRETGLIAKTVILKAPAEPAGSLQFIQGDAQDLPGNLGQFDFVLAANLLCRLAHPHKFLERLPGLVRAGGQLLITTPNTWLEEFTAREYWLGATPDTGTPLEALRKSLQATFVLDKVWDMPFLIREHHRKFQWSVAQASRWIRKD